MSTTAETSPTRQYQVRSATASDNDAVFGLLQQVGGNFVPQRDAFDLAFATTVDASDDHALLVAASDDGAVVGYALTTISRLFSTNGIAAQLHELVVDDAWRGHRVGTTLVSAVENYCRGRGVVQLTVASLRGAAFYEGLGYRSTADYLKKSLEV